MNVKGFYGHLCNVISFLELRTGFVFRFHIPLHYDDDYSKKNFIKPIILYWIWVLFAKFTQYVTAFGWLTITLWLLSGNPSVVWACVFSCFPNSALQGIFRHHRKSVTSALSLTHTESLSLLHNNHEELSNCLTPMQRTIAMSPSESFCCTSADVCYFVNNNRLRTIPKLWESGWHKSPPNSLEEMNTSDTYAAYTYFSWHAYKVRHAGWP